MTEHSLHPPLQSAYRSHHSTETALVKVVNDLLLAIDRKQSAYLIMLDLSAAFDTVNHEVLLERLRSDLGMVGDIQTWLQSYFIGRKQTVRVDGGISTPQPLKTGVPQGSLLGPFCFPPYTAPLFNIIHEHGCDVHMYADDTQIYLFFENCESKENLAKLELCISDIREWMKNHLKLNDSKTEFIILTSARRNIPDTNSVKIGESHILAVPSAKNIGAIIDSHLSMEKQVSNVCKNCYLSMHQISQIRQYLTEDATAKLVNALITSKLDFNNSLLIGIPDYLIRRLQLIQNNAARLVTRSNPTSITSLLKKLHWLPISFRIKYKVLLLCYKCLNNLAPSYLASMLKPFVSNREGLRSGDKDSLAQPTARLKTYGDRAFSVYAPRQWNGLPESLKQCPSVDSFKTNLKTYLFKQAFKH